MYHGTSASHLASIRANGLRPPSWFTSDEQRARGYAARAVAVVLCAHGRPDGSGPWPDALVLALTLADLEADRAHDGDYIVRTDVLLNHSLRRLYTFDVRPWMRPDQVAEFGRLAELAREIEVTRQGPWSIG